MASFRRCTLTLPRIWDRFILCHKTYEQPRFIPLWNLNFTSTRQMTYEIRKVLFSADKRLSVHYDKISVSKVSSNIEIRKHEGKPTSEVYCNDNAKSLAVIFFPFNMTSPKVLDGYCNLYLEYGLDVLVVKGRFRHVLNPASGRILARQLLDYLSQNETQLNMARFLFHSISFGDYIFALLQHEIREQPARYNMIKRKISGLVCDSLTTGVPTFPVMSLQFGSHMLHYTTKKLMSLYWLAFSKHKEFYTKVLESFRKSAVKGNVLVFYSLNDPLHNVQLLDETIRCWKSNKSADVAVSCWANSVHGRHLFEHPEQYRNAIHTFITKLHLVPCSITL